MENINIASFSEANTATVKGIWQYDFGQILRIEGLGLPDAVEVHFSLQKTGGEAKRRIGVTKDGVTDVRIPDFILEEESSVKYSEKNHKVPDALPDRRSFLLFPGSDLPGIFISGNGSVRRIMLHHLRSD